MKLSDWLKKKLGFTCDFCGKPRSIMKYDEIYLMNKNDYYQVSTCKVCPECADLFDNMKNEYVKRDERI